MRFLSKKTKKSKNWRVALVYLALFGAAPSVCGANEIIREVKTDAELRAAIAEYNGATGDDFRIVLTGNVKLEGDLPGLTGNADLVGKNGGSLVIEGNGYSIDGAGAYRGLYIDSGKTGATISVSNANFVDCVAQGGDGGSGAAGAGGGMGAGAAIYAASGKVVLQDVSATNNKAIGGNGGSVALESSAYGGGGGLGGNGGNGGSYTSGGANGGGVSKDGDSLTKPDGKYPDAGNGGETSADKPDSFGHKEGNTNPVGGNSLYGGGGGGSVGQGGVGGFGGGGGAGATQGGAGGFGAGGGGGASQATGGLGGFGGGDAGYQEESKSDVHSNIPGGGTGGGGAALGAAIFVGEDADVSFVVSENGGGAISGNVATAGQGGGGTAQNGEAIGSGVFLLNDLKIEVAKGATYTIADGIGGVAGSKNETTDENGNYRNDSGIVKTGEGTLVLNSKEAATYSGATVVEGGTLVAQSANALGAKSELNVKNGNVQLGANQTVADLTGGSGGKIELGGNTLTVSNGGDGSGVYNGTIQAGNGGVLRKEGTGTLTLAGDSRGSENANNLTTELVGGTVRAANDGAFGDGTIVYSRTDANDQTNALELADGVSLDNNIVLKGNTQAFKVGGENGALNGKISADAEKPGTKRLEVAMSGPASTLKLTNTGVTKSIDEKSGETIWTYRSADANDLDEIVLSSGTLELASSSFENADGTRFWYNAVGNAALTNQGDNRLTFALDADKADASLYFANALNLTSGVLTVDGGGANVEYGGKTNGAGGLRIDVGSGKTFALIGTFGHAATDLASGTLDVSKANGQTIALGALSSSASDVAILAGEKALSVGFDGSDATFVGKIVGEGDGTTITKTGTGAWTASFLDGSNVKKIAVDGGAFSLGSEHYGKATDVEIALGSGGTFRLNDENGGTLILDNFNAATSGSAIEIGEKNTLKLSNKNAQTKIAANLSGKGTLALANVVVEEGEGENKTEKVVDWTIFGDNSNWAGTIEATETGAKLSLASTKATSQNSAITLGDSAVLNVLESNALGTLTFGEDALVGLASGRKLTVDKLIGGSNALKIDVGANASGIRVGELVLNGPGAASEWTGAATVSGGATLTVVGDNRAPGREATTLTGGGTLYLDYSKEDKENGVFESLWGADLNVQGSGVFSVADAKKEVSLNENIVFDAETKDNKLTFSTSNADVVWRGSVAGDGTIVKTGTGTLKLDGTSAIQKLTVGGGVLQVGLDANSNNTQLANAAVAVTGGSLHGWVDSLGSLKMSSGAVNFETPGTITLTGTGNVFEMNGGTIYVDVASLNDYTKFETESGDVALNKGAFYVDVAKDAEIKSGDALNVVSTESGEMEVSNRNLTIYDNLVGTRFVVDASDGKFNLVAQDVDYARGATRPNEQSVGAYLNSWVDGGGLDPTTYDFVAALENATLDNPSALNQLTGELRYSALHAQMSTRNLIRQTLTQNVLPRASSLLDGSYTGVRGQDGGQSGASGWASAFGAGGSADDRKGVSGYDYTLLGGIFGLELGSNPTNQFGLYYSYSTTGLDANATIGSVDVSDNQFGAYLRWNDGWGYGFVTGGLGLANYSTSRAINFGGHQISRYESEADGWSGSVYAERGYTFELAASNLQPYGGVQFTHYDVDASTETGALQALALKTGETDYDSLQGVLGVRWTRSAVMAQRLLDFNVYANWTHEFLDANAEGQAAFVGGPNGTFRVVGNGTGRDWVYAGLGGTWTLSDSFSAFGGADVQVNSYTTYVNGSAGMKFSW